MPKRPSRGRSKSRGSAGRRPDLPPDTGQPASPEPALAELPAPEPVPVVVPVPVVRPAPPRTWDTAPATTITPSPLLADALSAVVTRAAEQQARDAVAQDPRVKPRQSVPSGWLSAALAGWLLVAFVLLAPPAIARGPADRPWQPPRDAAEASLRYGLWLARGRVDALVLAEGRVPPRLGDVGVVDTSLTLVVTGRRAFRIEGRQGALRLSLSSSMAADSFLGASLETLRR